MVAPISSSISPTVTGATTPLQQLAETSPRLASAPGSKVGDLETLVKNGKVGRSYVSDPEGGAGRIKELRTGDAEPYANQLKIDVVGRRSEAIALASRYTEHLNANPLFNFQHPHAFAIVVRLGEGRWAVVGTGAIAKGRFDPQDNPRQWNWDAFDRNRITQAAKQIATLSNAREAYGEFEVVTNVRQPGGSR